MRKRKTRYQWLQPLGIAGNVFDENDDTVGRETVLLPWPNGTTYTKIVPLIADFPEEDIGAGGPMGYVNNNDYIIKRIVGKLFVGVAPSATGASGVLVAAGIFAARADSGFTAGAGNLPIGATNTGIQNDTYEYGPLHLVNSTQPWIWRRTWVLGNSGVAADAVSRFPVTNAGYGSIQDGPHIDAKTARRVNKEERLWLALSARNMAVNSNGAAPGAVYTYFEARFLGRMARARNRGVF